MIANQLKHLSYDLMDIQIKKEQQAGVSTLIQNKRNGDEFIMSSKDFLNNNFYCLAQKYYISNFIEKSSDSLTMTFENNFNNIVIELLNQNDIKKQIDECFLKKYQEFEEKMKNINTKITLNPNSFKDNKANSNSNNNNFQIISDFSINNSKNFLSDINSVTTIPLPMNKSNSRSFGSNSSNLKHNKKY